MPLPNPLNLQAWIDEHRHLLKPPVGNKVVFDGDFIVMVVGADYHWDEGAEWFHQIEGEMVLRIQEDDGSGRLAVRDIPIRAGESFLLPPRVPHSPQRMPDSIGMVIERKRLAHEDDGLMWFCENCNEKIYEEYFHLVDIENDFPPVFDRFYSSREHRTCKACGHLNPAPAKYTMPDT